MKKFYDLKRLRLVGLITIVVIMVSACSGAFPTIQADQVKPASSAEDQTIDEVSEEVEAVVASPAPSEPESSKALEEIGSGGVENQMPSTEISDIAPTDVSTEEVKQEPEVVVREQLVATDPSTVSLASGEVQLVEFFAFW